MIRQPLEQAVIAAATLVDSASYGVFGTAVPIAGMGDLTAHIKTAAGAGAVLFEVYVESDYQAAVPTAITTLTQAFDHYIRNTETSGTPAHATKAWELTVAAGAAVSIPLPWWVSGAHLLFRAKDNGTDCTVNSFVVTGNVANT